MPIIFDNEAYPVVAFDEGGVLLDFLITDLQEPRPLFTFRFSFEEQALFRP